MGKIKYKQLSITEREIVSILKELHTSLRDIAKALKRDPTTICRELKRNALPVYTAYYLAHKAHQRAGNRKSKAHQRQRLNNDAISAYVQDKLFLGWSPEQISGRLSQDNT